MEKTDLIWLAGFIDGEGAIYIDKVKRNTIYFYPEYHPVLQVSNTYLPVMKALELKGFGHLHTLFFNDDRRKTAYWIRMCKLQELRDFLPKLIPFLRVKKKQAVLLLEYVESRFKKFHLARRDENRGYSKRELEIYQELRKLNRKGGSQDE